MTTRRPLSELALILLARFPTKSNVAIEVVAEVIQDWFDEDNADYVLKEDTSYYVCKLASTNPHPPNPVIEEGMGFSFLKKGDAFDLSKEGFHRAHGQGRIYQATSDFKNGRICANERYNPEI